jgi:hypothetical protein
LTDTKSIADLLRASVEHASETEDMYDIQLPDFEPTLHVTLRKVKSYRENVEIYKGTDKIKDTSDQALEMAARTLVAAAQDVWVIHNGAKTSLGVKLGLELYEAIFGSENNPTAPQNDVQAIYALYRDDEMALTNDVEEYAAWRRGKQADAVEEVLDLSSREITPPAT